LVGGIRFREGWEGMKETGEPQRHSSTEKKPDGNNQNLRMYSVGDNGKSFLGVSVPPWFKNVGEIPFHPCYLSDSWRPTSFQDRSLSPTHPAFFS